MSTDLAAVRFVVVKFVADPIRDEPVNIGVIASTAAGIEARFLDSMTRYRSILDSSSISSATVLIKFLRSSVDRCTGSLEQLSERLSGQVRLSELMGGLCEDIEAFLDDQFEIYVTESPSAVRARPAEDRTKVKEKIRKAIGGIGRQSEIFALGKRPVLGKLGKFKFDFGFLNGKATLVHALSFQTEETYALNEAKVLTFAAIDTKKLHRELTVAAVVAPPPESTPVYDEALRVLSSETTVINADDVDLSNFVGGVLDQSNVKPIPSSWLEPVLA